MMKLIKFRLIITLIPNFLFANNQYFKEGIDLYKNKKFQEAKFKFEQDIVYNPKNEISYLYLAKIFKSLKDKDLEEQNLNTVILLNPKNEEATFNLAKLKLEASDYLKSKELIKKLSFFCSKYCLKSKKLEIEIENLSKK